MKKTGDGRLMKRASYALLALVMAAAMSACGSKKEEEPVAEQTVAETEQAVQRRRSGKRRSRERRGGKRGSRSEGRG